MMDSSYLVWITLLKGYCLWSSFVVTAMSEIQFSVPGQFILAYPHQEAVTMLAQSQNSFTRDLYAQLSRGKTGNLFFSPFSVMASLSMVFGGAGGRTQQEMKSVLHLTQDTEDLYNAFHDLLTDIKKESSDYELRLSNTACISAQLPILKEFADTLREKFLSSAKAVDFAADDAVREEINMLVEQETNSHIKDLIAPGLLTSSTRMVLVNAVFFKGLWEHQFDLTATKEEDFWISEKERITVPMMHIRDKEFRMAYRSDLGATLLAIDYKGSKLSMLFVLPDEREGLPAVEAKLSQMDLLSNLNLGLHAAKIEVAIPRFRLEEKLDLTDHLIEMRMRDLFDESMCDLSGISGGKDLFVSHIIHKAFIEVSEQGTEAAAATGVVVMMRSLPMTFIADHPFLFYIRDEQSGLLLFAGRLTDPESHRPKDEL